mgnify:CR=1 FL=1
METFDDSSLTPTQIVSWVVTYDPLPELAINPKKSWFLDSNIVQQGDSIYFSVAIENISPFDMDSLKINYHLENENGQQNIPYQRQDSLRSRKTIIDTVAIPTRYLNDKYLMWVTANPKIRFENRRAFTYT